MSEILCAALYHSPPDIGLFGTDVVTDLINGRNMILNGDIIWGSVMVSIPFLPMTIAMLYCAFGLLSDGEPLGLFLLIMCLPAAALCTPIYIGWILLAALVKLKKPVIKDDDEVLGGCLDGDNVKMLPALFRMGEVVAESYPQALLGKFTSLQIKLLSQDCSIY